MFFVPNKNFDIFKKRRQQAIQKIRSQMGNPNKGVLLICSGFENHRYNFRQESSFFYLTGISEPASILCCYFDGPDVLYIPFYNQNRDQWVHSQIFISSSPQEFGLDKIRYQGTQISGYSCPPLFTVERYADLVADLKSYLGNDGVIYTLMNDSGWFYFHQMQLVSKLNGWLEPQHVKIEDISDIVDDLRRVKDSSELDLISKAVDVTIYAQHQAACVIKPGKFEYQIQALIDSAFKDYANCSPAFPSIVASGKNSTVLHSLDSTRELKNGDLVVIDIGAEFGMYSSDITRTYPVSGKFTERQKEVYNIVLDTQLYVQSIAKPGMYLNNKIAQNISLHHLAVKFLEKHEYSKYFVHGIGHFMGLDVHDVGCHEKPLLPGDVFTIEPGIYIAEENLGIRIEDDFVITETGCKCLSEKLVKQASDIESMMWSKY
ncbi:MAG: Aminopeptidase P domain protein [candidate division TM6 bacterium GW2011_GWF2_37_49]|nr:MAG: Aminopeptidase P domain protein [candidate division TM6 bacterium GW2011_GWF2_37_49]